jgi:transcriptional regulator with XRE-family HTH domain
VQVASDDPVVELRPVEWTLAERIRKVRDEFGMEQPEFGALFGVTEKAVSTWETGRNHPRNLVNFAMKVQALAAERGLEVPWEWLVAGGAHNPRYGNIIPVVTELELMSVSVG